MHSSLGSWIEQVKVWDRETLLAVRASFLKECYWVLLLLPLASTGLVGSALGPLVVECLS